MDQKKELLFGLQTTKRKTYLLGHFFRSINRRKWPYKKSLKEEEVKDNNNKRKINLSKKTFGSNVNQTKFKVFFLVVVVVVATTTTISVIQQQQQNCHSNFSSIHSK